jgi:hypothetical protein
MNIRPTPEFLEACRILLGDDSPAAVLTAIRAGGPLMDDVRLVHELIVKSKQNGDRAEFGCLVGSDGQGNLFPVIAADGRVIGFIDDGDEVR